MGIYKLLPGEVVEFRDGQLSATRLWRLPPEGSATAKPDSELQRLQLRAALEAAVLRRLPPGEPVGAFLSGGIDSSLVVALARRLHNSDVFTYSVTFGSGYPNELPFSTLVAEHCRTVHRIVELSPEVVRRHLDESVALLSDPIGDPLTVPNALLFREAAREVNVVLNGEGGDPCFGGPKNLPMLLAELFGDGMEQGSATDSPSNRERSYLRAHQKCYDDLSAMLAPDVLSSLPGGALSRKSLRSSPTRAGPAFSPN